MIDIMEITTDIGILNSNVKKAENILSVQLGSLEYASDLGVDLAYFLSEDFQFQNEAFKSYLLQRLAESSIDVMSVVETVNTLYDSLVFNLPAGNATTALMR
jgi:hypothetical protein